MLKKKIKPLAGLTCCWFNTLTFPFSNVNLRKALAYAIPRDKLLEQLFLPNVLSARNFNLFKPSVSIQENQETAKDLFQTALKELKVKQLTLTLSYEATDELSRMATLLKAYWEEILPVRVHLEPLLFKELWLVLPQRRFQFCLIYSLSQYTDPINFLEHLEFKNDPVNLGAWENVNYQKYLKQYRKATKDEKRQALLEKVEAILCEEMPIAPIYYYHFVYLQKRRVKNLSISPIGIVQFDRVFLKKQRPAKESLEDPPFSINASQRFFL